MSVKATISALVLAAASVVAAWMLRAPSIALPAAQTQQSLPKLAGLLDHEIQRITLRRGGQESLVFDRRSDGWMQTAPFACPMDRFSIDQFIALAAKLRAMESISRTGGHSPTLAGLSLDPPLAVVTYEWDGGQVAVELGRPGIAGRAVLRVVGDERVHVVAHDLHDRVLNMDEREWRDRRLFRGPPVEGPGEIEQVVLTAGVQRIVVTRDRRRWLMVEPAATRADSAAMDELISAISRAVNGGFILDQPADLARFSLDPPAGSLTVIGAPSADQGPAVQRLLVGATIGVNGQNRFGMIEGRPMVLRLSAAALAALFRSAESLVDPTACGVISADVKSLRISGPAGEFRLQRDLERWLAPDHDGTEVPAKSVNELLNVLTQVRAARISFTSFPRDAQVGHVTLLGFSDRPLDTVRVASDQATGDWIMDNGDNVLRIFPAGITPGLSPGSFGLKAP